MEILYMTVTHSKGEMKGKIKSEMKKKWQEEQNRKK